MNDPPEEPTHRRPGLPRRVATAALRRNADTIEMIAEVTAEYIPRPQ